MSDERFLLGKGETLTQPTPSPSGGATPHPPYSFDEAIARLKPMVAETASDLRNLPERACANGEVVAAITLHPQGLAKSYHPKRLFNDYSLRQVGSRPVNVKPEKWSKKGAPELSPSNELYVAGQKSAFERWAEDFQSAPRAIRDSICRIEEVRPVKAKDRLRHLENAAVVEDEYLIEFLLHASPDDFYVIEAFERWAMEVGANPKTEKKLFAGGLCFIPGKATRDQIDRLADFSLLRTARPLSRIRDLPTVPRTYSNPFLSPAPLPALDSLDPSITVAVFDGGLPPSHRFQRWVNYIEPTGISSPITDLQTHGQGVTSALLFGALEPGRDAPQPYCNIDHFRVLDDQVPQDPYELYDVLHRIIKALETKDYDFVNLSLGPALCIEDDDIHPWTAVLDTYLASGKTMMTIAAGNNGDSADILDRRVQVPSDCVNALAVGSTDSVRSDWKRASYSAIGPGRAPGFVKPDLLDFGGTSTEPFYVSDSSNVNGLAATCGTSFAAPSTLRRAIEIKAKYGSNLSPQGIKALLIHSAESREQSRSEVGWGRTAPTIEDIMLCRDGQVRVIYQGHLEPSKYLRAELPLPAEKLLGNVEITATFAFACQTDPEDPGNYSRSGLEIVFRPHAKKFKDGAMDPKSASFFKKTDFDKESILRRDAQKWETTVHGSRRFRGSSLHKPTFDIHYNARTNGGDAYEAEPIPYSLVVSVEASSTPDLYERVAQQFAGRLEVFSPVHSRVQIKPTGEQ